MFSSSNPGMLAKLKSRGLSGLAVRQRRLTTNELEHPPLDEESHASPSPSQLSQHPDTVLTSSPFTNPDFSPGPVAAVTIREINHPHDPHSTSSEALPVADNAAASISEISHPHDPHITSSAALPVADYAAPFITGGQLCFCFSITS